MAKLSLHDLKGSLTGKKVLVRVDFNVPLDKDTGRINDDRRIRSSLPTLSFIRDEGGIPVLMSHLGRPKGQRKPECSLTPAAERLGELLGAAVAFAPDCVGPEADKIVAQAGDGDVVLLENLRYHKEETKNDPEFAASYAGISINESLKGEAELAQEAADQMLSRARNFAERQGAMFRSVTSHLFAGNNEAAMEVCETMLAEAVVKGDRAAMAVINDYMGDMMLVQGDAAKAEEYFNAALEHRTKAAFNVENQAQAKRTHLFKTAIAVEVAEILG